jgi:hypothetical protein
MDLFTVVILVIVAAYLFMVATKPQEGFVANLMWLPDKRPNEPKVIMEQHIEAPYVQNPIYSVDDYEYNLVFQNETDKELSKKQIDRLTSQYPLDWSNHPPSSSVFQKGLEEMNSRLSSREGFQDTAEGTNPYKEIDGSTLEPPADNELLEQEERKILQTYKPSKNEDLVTYDLEDARKLIKKIYDAKGMVPTVVKKPNNVFEVVGVRKKDEKVVYEDEEAPVSAGATAMAGEATITVPPTAADIAVGLDPFYSPNEASRAGRWDYTKWTPGLERSFAPTFAQKNWS